MSNPLDFTGKRALIVGGSSGIGHGIARGFVECGAEVHHWNTSQEDNYNGGLSDFSRLTFHQLDVTDRSAASKLSKLAGDFDMLVKSGSVRYGREEFERPGWDAVVESI